MSKKRYFIVSYNHGNGSVHGSGQTSFTTDGCYLNQQKTIELIKPTIRYEDAVIAIQNIIELSESDYNDWIAEQQDNE
ncbi:MAG: hypothetical protein LUI85_02835 [Bacteroides sp.]|nr:hypothetical protein [Bacteroides sp.]